MQPVKTTQNLLVVLPAPLGDAVLALGALHRLRAALPEVHLTLAGSPSVRRLLEGEPLCDDWLKQTAPPAHKPLAAPLRRPATRFDAVILLKNSFRSAAHAAWARIPLRIGYARDGRTGLLTHSIKPTRLARRFMPLSMAAYYQRLIDYAITVLQDRQNTPADVTPTTVPLLSSNKTAARRVDAMLQRWQVNQPDPLAMLVPGGAFGPSKHWPTERFAALADRLAQKGYRVIVCCSPAEQAISQAVAQAAQATVLQTADEKLDTADLKELIRRCSLMVANDTGPCHLAAALGLPLVTLFGPTDPRWTATGYDGEIRLRVDVPCGPCQQKHCHPGHHQCLQQITLDQVWQAVERITAADTPTPTAWNGTLSEPSAGEVVHTPYRPYDEDFLPTPTGLTHRHLASLLRRHGLDTLQGVFNYTAGQSLTKPGLGRRQRLRLCLTDDQGHDVVLYLKRFGQGTWSQRLKGLLRFEWAPAGLREFANTLALAQADVAVPRPVAFGCEKSMLTEGRSYFISEELSHADALERLLPAEKQIQKRYKMLQQRRTLSEATATLVRRLHQDARMFHRDLYLAHLFLGRDRSGNEQLSLIDLQRVFRPLLRRRRWRVKDLAQLYYSAKPYCSRAEALRFLRCYFAVDRLNKSHHRLARSVAAKAARIQRRQERKQNKRQSTPAP